MLCSGAIVLPLMVTHQPKSTVALSQFPSVGSFLTLEVVSCGPSVVWNSFLELMEARVAYPRGFQGFMLWWVFITRVSGGCVFDCVVSVKLKGH